MPPRTLTYVAVRYCNRHAALADVAAPEKRRFPRGIRRHGHLSLRMRCFQLHTRGAYFLECCYPLASAL